MYHSLKKTLIILTDDVHHSRTSLFVSLALYKHILDVFIIIITHRSDVPSVMVPTDPWTNCYIYHRIIAI